MTGAPENPNKSFPTWIKYKGEKLLLFSRSSEVPEDNLNNKRLKQKKNRIPRKFLPMWLNFKKKFLTERKKKRYEYWS